MYGEPLQVVVDQKNWVVRLKQENGVSVSQAPRTDGWLQVYRDYGNW